MDIFLLLIGIIIFYRFARFITTPVFRKIGLYRYFSNLFFIMPLTKTKYEIHMGTTWDIFKLEKKKTKFLLLQLMDGLLNLIDSIEKKKIQLDIVFYGKIHFFKAATLKKYGFKVKSFNTLDYVFFIFHYLELFILKLIILKDFKLPKLSKLSKISFTAFEILQKKEEIKHIQKYLNSSLYGKKNNFTMDIHLKKMAV